LAAFLWVPFPFGILLTFGKENTFSLLSLNRKILSPPKEMEQKSQKSGEIFRYSFLETKKDRNPVKDICLF